MAGVLAGGRWLLPLDTDELAVYQLHTGRTTAPTKAARECWLPAGRRGGKSENLTARATWRAISRDWHAILAPGEVGTIPLIAADKDQARNSLGYLKGLARLPLVQPFVARVLKDAVEFRAGAVVRVVTASWKSTRGFTFLDVILEESAFFQVEGTSNPDREILDAVRPALLTVPGARLYSISSPYAKRGILWKAYADHWGRDDSDVLVFVADSVSLNPTLDLAEIDRAFEEDATAAASEYGRNGLVQFRSDVERFLSEDVLMAVTVVGRTQLPPLPNVVYTAFCDPSGGTGSDSFALALAHREGERAIVDVVVERKPPFNAESVVAEYAETLKAYRTQRVHGDKYTGAWVQQAFARHGIEYVASPLNKSEIYLAALPAFTSSRVELLDDAKTRAQFLTLDRRTSRLGRDTVDHDVGAHDDRANVVAGSLVLALEAPVTDWSALSQGIAEGNADLRKPEGRGYDPGRHSHPDLAWQYRRPLRG